MYAVYLGIQIFSMNPGQNHTVLHNTDSFVISSQFCSGSFQVQRTFTILILIRQIFTRKDIYHSWISLQFLLLPEIQQNFNTWKVVSLSLSCGSLTSENMQPVFYQFCARWIVGQWQSPHKSWDCWFNDKFKFVMKIAVGTWAGCITQKLSRCSNQPTVRST